MKLARLAACWLAIGVAAGLLVVTAVPLAFEMRAYTVLSGSMEPALDTADVVLVAPIAAQEARIGDIVTFKDPKGSGRLITHRVRGIRLSGGKGAFVTRGDANVESERWTVPQNGQIGKVLYRLPNLGYLAFAIGIPIVRLLLVTIPALALGCWLLLRIWRPPVDKPLKVGRSRPIERA